MACVTAGNYDIFDKNGNLKESSIYFDCNDDAMGYAEEAYGEYAYAELV